ncbi:MAG: TylF/MycF/NovP-related O-methyltransferase [Gammaproteobacteria bacterium]
MKVSSIPNKLLSVVGFRLIRQTDTQRRFPVEISDADKAIFEYVRNGKMSTSSDERLYATIMACRHVVEKKIAGDFVECGVWRGGNSIIAASVFKTLAAARSLWLFDTFAGMTEPTQFDVNFRGEVADIKFGQTQQNDHNDWCFAPIEEVRANFSNAGLLGESVRFVKGDVARTLSGSEPLPERISVLRLDTDWYESTKVELEVLYPRLTPGGILIIDDYGHWGGARKAVDEYFANGARPFLQYIDHTARIGVKRD